MAETKRYTSIFTPNVLTIIRIFLTVGILWFLFIPTLFMQCVAITLFVLAVITDFLDGYIARKYNLISDFGKIADPIADKFLILGLFVAFSSLELYSFVLILPIVIREVVVTVLRLLLLFNGKVIAAEKLGKYKVAFQVCCLCVSWMFYLIRDFGYESVFYNYAEQFELALFVTLVISIVLTVYSGLTFLFANQNQIARLGCARIIGTFFGCGLFPKMPGTVGTLGAVVLYFFIADSSLYLVCIGIAFLLGLWSSRFLSESQKDSDPQEVVIDEVVGFLITMYLIPWSLVNVLCGFILFRFFDILKPWPIKKIEKLNAGFGIMLDDVVAGIFAGIVLHVIYYRFLS